MKKIALILLFLLICFGILAEEPFKFNLGEIPWGESKDKVLSIIEKTYLHLDGGETVSPRINGGIEFIEAAQWWDVLQNYLKTKYDHDQYLDLKLVKSYGIDYYHQEGIHNINISFLRNQNNGENTRLFIVEKYFSSTLIPSSDKNFLDIYQEIKKGITKATNISPVEKLSEMQGSSSNEAFVSIWELNDQEIYLVGVKFMLKLEYLYLPIWKEYLDIIAKKKSEKAEKVKSSF